MKNSSTSPRHSASPSDPPPVDLRNFADNIRRRSLAMISRAKSSHIGSVFSTAEILAVLYGKVLRLKP